MADVPTLTIKIENSQPVELADLTTSFSAFARQYAKYVRGLDEVTTRDEAKLYVKEIRPGSIIADLVPYAQDIGAVATTIAPYAEDAKKVVGFAKYLKIELESLLAGKRPSDETSAKDLRELNQILEPVSKDIGGRFIIQARDSASVQVTINYNSTEANAIQNQSYRQIELMKEPEQKRFNKRLMYWYAASRGKSSKTTDKAIIETIDPKPLPVFIEDPEMKATMLAGRENPFLIGFMVDVELLIVRGDVRGYSILHLHGTLEDDGDAPSD